MAIIYSSSDSVEKYTPTIAFMDGGFGVSFQTSEALFGSQVPAFGPGSIWDAEGVSYEEASALATDHDAVTAGGVKLYVRRVAGNPITPEPYATSGISDDVAMQAAAHLFGDVSMSANDTSGGGVITLKANKTYVLHSQVLIPHHMSIDMNGAIIIPAADGDFPDGFMFRLNASRTGEQVRRIGGRRFPFIRGGTFENPENLAGIKIFHGRSKHRFEDLEVENFSGVYKKEGDSNYDYTDLLNFKRINVNSTTGSDWIFDIGYHGDGFLFEEVHVGGGGENRNVLRLSRCRGGSIVSCINGTYKLEHCQAITIQGHHSEWGQIISESSDVSIEGAHIWRHVQEQGNKGIIKSIKDTSENPAGQLTLSNINFWYQQGRNELPQSAEPDSPDVVIDETSRVSVRACSRFGAAFGIPGDGARTAMKVGLDNGDEDAVIWSKWERAAPLYSMQSEITGGMIHSSLREVPMQAAYTRNAAPFLTTNYGGWERASGTKYYRDVALIGPVDRLIGKPGAEFSAAPVEEGVAPVMRYQSSVASEPAAQITTLRMFRGDASGSYGEYLDLHPAGQPVFIDLGYRLAGGEYWVSRSASQIGNYNPAIKVELRGDNVTAYMSGAAVLSSDGTTTLSSGLPPVGTWTKGDRVVFPHSTVEYNGTQWATLCQSGTILPRSDAGYSLSLASAPVVTFDTPITANRYVQVPVDFPLGYEVTLVRGVGCTGSFSVKLVKTALAETYRSLDVAGCWVTVKFNGTSWVTIRQGTL